MKILVTGGRNFGNETYIHSQLAQFEQDHGKITSFAHGGAKGVDTIAGSWAELHNIPTKIYKANWDTFGKAAGPMRNQEMLADFNPDWVIVFPGGKGTSHMRHIAKQGRFKIKDYK